MSRADLMYDALTERPGEFVSRHQLFRHAETFYLTNNAASEVRAKYGVDVEHDFVEGEHSYRLASALGAVSTIGPSDVPSSTPVAASCDGVSGGHSPEHNSAPAGARTPSVPSRGAQALTRRVSGAEQLVLTSSGHVNAHSEGARVDVAEEVKA